MAQKLCPLAALPEDMGLIPSIYWWLPTVCNFSSNLTLFSSLYMDPISTRTHVQGSAQTQKKYFKKL